LYKTHEQNELNNAIRRRADEPARSSSLAGTLSHQGLWDWVLAGSVATLLVCYNLTAQSIAFGSQEGHWIYSYVRPFNLGVIMAWLLASTLAGAVLFVAKPGVTRRDWPVVLMWIAIGHGVQAIVRSVTPFSFERIFENVDANGFYTVTQLYDAGSVLADYDRLRAAWPLHAQSNMPGKLMLLYALRGLSHQPGPLAWLILVVSNLGALFMYLFVVELFRDRRMAIYSAVLYLLVPAKLYFFPLMNTVTPVVVLASAALMLRWLRTSSVVSAAQFGLALFGLVFFEPLPLVIGLLFALLVYRAIWIGQIPAARFLSQAGVGVAACLVAYGTVRILFGFDLVSAFRQIGGHAVRFNQAANRPYSIWVWRNLPEFLFGGGVCQAILFCAAVVDGCRGEGCWRERLTRPIVVLCVGVAAVLLVTDLLGVNRGEVIRLWIFLACFFQIPAAYVCARLDSRWAMVVVMTLTLLQATLGTAMVGFVGP
jgi:hypothetical protein